nr:EOG090X0EEI [Lepidurus arcticus]
MQRDNPKNMQALLRFALSGTEKEDRTHSTDLTAMSEERRRWLSEALENLSVSVVDKLTKALEVLSAKSEVQDEQEPSIMEEALDTIINFVDYTDNANDFQKIGGLSVLKPCLESSHNIVREKCAELIATLTQNNPYCQKHILQADLLPVLLKMTEEDSSKAASVKAVSAISCLCRNNLEAQQELGRCDGILTLIRLLQTDNERMRNKTAFFLAALCQENATYCNDMCSKGLVEQIANLLQKERDASHEHLISALVTLVGCTPQALLECRRSDLMLETVLKSCIENADPESNMEEIEGCRQLLALAFPAN